MTPNESVCDEAADCSCRSLATDVDGQSCRLAKRSIDIGDLTMKWKLGCVSFFVCALSLTGSSPALIADDSFDESNAQNSRVRSSLKRLSKPAKADAKVVEMFEAMEQGLLTVDYIGKDATQANILFRNKGNEPLNILLPATFGAIPVLAQGAPGGFGGGGGGIGGGGGGGLGGGGGGQGIGGGFGGGGGGNGGGQGIGGIGGGQGGGGPGGGQGVGGFFRVEPDMPRKMNVATVCLNHGKADPNPKMKYQVVRLAEVNDSLVIEGFCRGLASGKVSQNVAQAAAWHVANGLTWDELEQKPKVVSEYTGIELFFSKSEIEAAIRLTELVKTEVKSLEGYSANDKSASSSGAPSR